MEIKVADDKQSQIDALTSLLGRPDAPPPTRKRIEQEIRNIRAGTKGERDAAYEIDFHYRHSRNFVTIHDLRIECDGRVAQIDHLIINRIFEIWVCESKWFSYGVAINEHGEWSAFYGRGRRGIASPIEQNKRHVSVLSDVFNKGLVKLPKRLGMTMKPSVKTVVLVANTARIDRPRGRAADQVEGIHDVIKCERLFATMDKAWDEKGVAVVLTLVGQETIEILARDLVKLHVPGSFDWAAKFGLTKEPLAIPVHAPAILNQTAAVLRVPGPAVGEAEPHESSSAVCESCAKAISSAEVAYCRNNATRFSGKVLCFTCQRRARRVS